MLIALLGTLTIVLHQVKTWPQTIRILRRRDAAGVSALTWSLVLTGNLTWVVYGVVLGDLVLMVTNVGAAVAAAAILVAMARQRAAPAGLVGWVGLGAVGCAVGLVRVAGTPTLAAVAVGLVMVMFVPQAVKVFRAPVSGVSPATWWLQLVSSAAWLAYGVAADQPAIVLCHLVVLPCAVAVVARLAMWSPLRPVREVRTVGEAGSASGPGVRRDS